MNRIGVAMLVTLGVAIAVPLSGQAPPQTPVPSANDEGSEILVIARKLRRVQLNYAMRGPFVVGCDAAKSSGDERIDRIMCAILRSCVKAGNREVPEAKACMMARIDALAEEGARVSDVASAAPGPAPAPAPTAAPAAAQTPVPIPTQRPADTPEIVVTGTPDIVVTAAGPQLRGGLWQFKRSATLVYGGGGVGDPIRFTQCLPPGGLEERLRRAAGDGIPMPRRDRCSGMRPKIGGGRIDGRQNCMRASPRGSGSAQLTLSGRYDAKQLILNFAVEAQSDAVDVVTRPVGYRWRVTATRLGECPVRPERMQVTEVEAITRLFAVDGAADETIRDDEVDSAGN